MHMDSNVINAINDLLLWIKEKWGRSDLDSSPSFSLKKKKVVVGYQVTSILGVTPFFKTGKEKTDNF